MNISGWGNHPVMQSQQHHPRNLSKLREILSADHAFEGVARGMGRSYGDSSLAPETVNMCGLNQVFHFDPHTGVIECLSGVTLDNLLEIFLPKGWFLPVTPGTRFITVGGAIASDVHGKNHHNSGSFCDDLISFHLLLATGETVQCSTTENVELFRATCGGMGLTGIIIDARFNLIPIESSMIEQTTIKTANINETLEVLEEHQLATYSVAWIDCLATGSALGRSLVMLGEHASTGGYGTSSQLTLTVPFEAPSFLLNQFTGKIFNSLVYNKAWKSPASTRIHCDPYFYPLDRVHQWNLLYGKSGFTQYQFVIPIQAGAQALNEILTKIAASDCAGLLAVLKLFGAGNDNLLSFPMEGITLAVDFKLTKQVLLLMDELDQLVIHYGGRIYLAKDCRLEQAAFRKMYSRWEEFMEIRTRYGADHVFQSLQSNRLGL